MTNFTPGTNMNPMAGFVPMADFQRLAEFAQNTARMMAGQMLLTKKRLFPVEAEWKIHQAGRKPRTPVKFRSQFGEDVAIYELLDGQTEGLYIECGAFDGESFSVSYAFDAMGWDGLLVEAIPERAEQCRKARPHAKVEHTALGRPGAGPTTTFTVADDMWGGMLSYATTDQEHINSLAQTPKRSVTVPMTTMDALLAKHFDGRRVDAAVIDVEGGELDLLAGFDLNRWKPKVLLLEDNQGGRDPRLETYMKSQPYTLLGWLEVNRIYVHNDQKAIFDRVSGRG